jgi:hypothetical protein
MGGINEITTTEVHVKKTWQPPPPSSSGPSDVEAIERTVAPALAGDVAAASLTNGLSVLFNSLETKTVQATVETTTIVTQPNNGQQSQGDGG